MVYEMNGVRGFYWTMLFFTLSCLNLSILGVSRANDTMPNLEAANNGSIAPGEKPVPSNLPIVNPEQAALRAPFGLSLDTTYISQYIYFGLDYSNQKPVQQSEMILTFKKISGIVWFNYDFQTYQNINEYDLTVQYGDKFGPAAIQTGYTFLTFPHRGWRNSDEVWIQGNLENVLNPSVSLHDDFQSGNGWYYSFGISHPFELPTGTLTPGALIYYLDHYYHNTGTPSAEFDLADTFVYKQITSNIKFSYYRALNTGDFTNLQDQFVYGLNLAWSLP